MPTESVPIFPGRFLVLGCGSIGKRHIANLKRLGVKDLAVFDPLEERRKEVVERFAVFAHESLDSALANSPKVAIVCSPTKFHVKHALLAAQLGCHLFIEKPIAVDPDEATHLASVARQRNLVTLVGCNFRFHPGMVLLRELLSEAAVGRIVSARAQFGQYLPDWHPWEDYRKGYSARREMGGGVVLDRIHELDYLCWLLGDVDAVTALVGHLSGLEINTEDTAEILLRFKSGAFGSVHLDYVRRTYDCSLEIVGEKGTIQWRYQDNELRWNVAPLADWETRRWANFDGNMMYVEEMKHFLRALGGLEDPVQDLASATRVLRLATAAKIAAERGCWIQL